jgi:hypothetical protein
MLEWNVGRGETMSEWIAARHKAYADKKAKKKLKEQHLAGAIAACPAMLQRLKGQVFEDVKRYNAFFCQHASNDHCRANVEDFPSGGFMVSVGPSSVRVTRQLDTAIICFEYNGLAASSNGPNCVQSHPDDDGKPGYWYGTDDQFIDELGLSKIILEPILCG